MNDSTLPKSILLLAANPKKSVSLRLHEEERDIKECLRLAGYGKVPINSTGATRPRDIQQAMLDFKPQIVHFSGHGAGEDGLVFEDATGQGKLVSSEALANLFRLFSNRVECVVLNACYSRFQAEAISQHIDYVIGMNQAIGDRAAIEFAVGFYKAIGAGESIAFAYELGCNAIQFEGIPEHLTPVLYREGTLTQSYSSDSSQIHSTASRGFAELSFTFQATGHTVPQLPDEFLSPNYPHSLSDDNFVDDYSGEPISSKTRRQFLKWAIPSGLGVVGITFASQFLGSSSNHSPIVQPSPEPSESSPTPEPGISAPNTNDYSTLEKFLKTGNWKEADRETHDLILKAAGLEQAGLLQHNSIIDCAVLSRIDQLWVQNSPEGKFGFSVQKKIYVKDCGGKLKNYNDEAFKYASDDEALKLLSKVVGWETGIVFDASAPKGHLPVTSYIFSWQAEGDLEAESKVDYWGRTLTPAIRWCCHPVFFMRLETCGI